MSTRISIHIELIDGGTPQHKTLNQCCFVDGLSSTTVAQYRINILCLLRLYPVILKMINQDRIFFADFSVNYQQIFMKFSNTLLKKKIPTARIFI